MSMLNWSRRLVAVVAMVVGLCIVMPSWAAEPTGPVAKEEKKKPGKKGAKPKAKPKQKPKQTKTIPLSAAISKAEKEVKGSRAIKAELVGETMVQTKTAPDFGYFDQTAYVEDRMWGCDAGAAQTSSLAPNGIDCTLASEPTDGLQIFGGKATSSMDITFTIAEATPFELSGSWNTVIGWSMSAIAEVKLTRLPSVVIFDQGHLIPPDAATGNFVAAPDSPGKNARRQYDEKANQVETMLESHFEEPIEREKLAPSPNP